MDLELEQRIARKVFEGAGITMDRKDPIFALAFIIKEIVKEDKEEYVRLQENVISEIQLIPVTLAKTLEKIVVAVEETENTALELCKSTKSALDVMAASKLQDTGEALSTVARDQVAVALSQIKLTFDALEVRAKTLGGSGKGNKKQFWSNMVFVTAILACVLPLPFFFYNQMTTDIRQDKEINFYARELIAIERSLASMPKSVQEHIKLQAAKEKVSLMPRQN